MVGDVEALQFKYAKFRVGDTLRLLDSRIFHHCRIFARCLSKMPLQGMRKVTKTRKFLRLPSSGCLTTDCCTLLLTLLQVVLPYFLILLQMSNNWKRVPGYCEYCECNATKG